jgi:hypothetical protein
MFFLPFLAKDRAFDWPWNDFRNSALHNGPHNKDMGVKLPSGEEYLFKAAAFFAKAESESDPEVRAGFENLARANLRLAEQALRNPHVEVTYEPPPKLNDPEVKQ